jgi:hypothetical protein
VSFREIKKESLQVQAPIEIAGLVREKAAQERKSISAMTTELLCMSLGRDPRSFGIEPTAIPA